MITYIQTFNCKAKILIFTGNFCVLRVNHSSIKLKLCEKLFSLQKRSHVYVVF